MRLSVLEVVVLVVRPMLTLPRARALVALQVQVTLQALLVMLRTSSSQGTSWLPRVGMGIGAMLRIPQR